MSLAMSKLTADDVRKAVELFWATFLAKSEEELNDSYAPGSTVFQVAMSRSEPGRLGPCAARANTSTQTRAWN
jgi:hypothetical protein